jgi:hypothetical protein
MYINYRMTPEGVSVITKDEASDLLGFGEKGYWGLLRHLKSIGAIEEVNMNGFYKTLKVNERVPVYDFLLNEKLTKSEKDFLIRMLSMHGVEYAPCSVCAKNLGIHFITYNSTKRLIEGKLNVDLFEYLKTIKEINSEPLPGIKITEGGAQKIQEIKPRKKISTEERVRRKLANIPKSLLKATKACAKRRKADHFLTEDDIREQLEKQDYRCYYTGVEFSENVIPSVDRIDSSVTYKKDNIVICDKRVNVMKSDMKLSDFLEMVELIHNNKGKM